MAKVAKLQDWDGKSWVKDPLKQSEVNGDPIPQAWLELCVVMPNGTVMRQQLVGVKPTMTALVDLVDAIGVRQGSHVLGNTLARMLRHATASPPATSSPRASGKKRSARSSTTATRGRSHPRSRSARG